MSKPATKEPSMDEILSSIRQIIADDDAAMPKRSQVAPEARYPAPAQPPLPEPELEEVLESEPLALSPDQILQVDDEVQSDDSMDFGSFLDDNEQPEDVLDVKAEFMDPDDIAFTHARVEEEAELPPSPPPMRQPAAAAPQQTLRMPPPMRPQAVSAPSARPRPSAAQAAPMPDPELSADIADELLEPVTNSAVRANFARLNNLSLGNSGLTIEAMMREMLRPLLKEWLDEHLPTLVERMVEREIARISRGVD